MKVASPSDLKPSSHSESVLTGSLRERTFSWSYLSALWPYMAYQVGKRSARGHPHISAEQQVDLSSSDFYPLYHHLVPSVFDREHFPHALLSLGGS